VAEVGEKELGASLHASIEGTVKTVSETFIEIEA
jgi:hypothetical protein